MRVKVLPDAQLDLIAVRTYVQAEYTHKGAVWYESLVREIESLGEHPYRGVVVRKSTGVRRILFGQRHNIYLIFYRIDEGNNEVVVLQLLHGMRKGYLR